MKICIVGAGAVGGLLAVRLARAGVTVTAIDHGARLEAMRRHGLVLVEEDGTRVPGEGIAVTGDFEAPGPQDYVMLAVKAHQIAAVAPRLEALYGAHTAVVTLQNGLPWWYFQRHPGVHEGRRLHALDPDGAIAAVVPVARVIGCVAYPAAVAGEWGVSRLVEGNRFTLGEPDGTVSPRCVALADTLVRAGFRSFVTEDIRAELWLKAWGALSFNTISALTGATMAEIAGYPPTRALVTAMMREAQAVAACLGVDIRHTIERRIEGAAGVGAHKTSMLQDVEAGRELELAAVIGAIAELARLTGTPAPAIDAVHACCALLNERLRTAEPSAGRSGRLSPSRS